MTTDWRDYVFPALSVASMLTILGYFAAETMLPGRRPSKLTSLSPRSRGVTSLIGNTPLVEIESLSRLTGCKVLAKLELANPGGSAKDRVALAIIRHHEKMGTLVPHQGDAIFEGTLGLTGILIATLANALGYEAHICLPDDTSEEKLQLLQALGAIIEPVKAASIVDPSQYTNAARRRAQESRTRGNRAIFADQFENDCNWRAHYSGTGPEIWSQTDHDIDIFILGSGTGGTISGVARYLEEQNSSAKIVLADPQGLGLANRVNHGVLYDSVEREGTRRRHQVDTLVEGIGLNRLTWNFMQGEALIHEAVRVSDDMALKMAKFLCVHDGYFWGSSAAVNCVAAVEMALKYGPGQTIVVIACDTGARHMSKFWKQAATVLNDITWEDLIADIDT